MASRNIVLIKNQYLSNRKRSLSLHSLISAGIRTSYLSYLINVITYAVVFELLFFLLFLVGDIDPVLWSTFTHHIIHIMGWVGTVSS